MKDRWVVVFGLVGLGFAAVSGKAPVSGAQTAVLGVAVLVDMFTSVDFASTAKRAQETGPRPMVHLVSSMTLATAAGGHGTEYGIKIPTIDKPEEAQAFVDARIAEGSDFIKIIYDDGKTYGMAIPMVSRETLAAIIRAAQARDKLVVVHSAWLRGVEEARKARDTRKTSPAG